MHISWRSSFSSLSRASWFFSCCHYYKELLILSDLQTKILFSTFQHAIALWNLCQSDILITQPLIKIYSFTFWSFLTRKITIFTRSVGQWVEAPFRFYSTCICCSGREGRTFAGGAAAREAAQRCGSRALRGAQLALRTDASRRRPRVGSRPTRPEGGRRPESASISRLEGVSAATARSTSSLFDCCLRLLYSYEPRRNAAHYLQTGSSGTPQPPSQAQGPLRPHTQPGDKEMRKQLLSQLEQLDERLAVCSRIAPLHQMCTDSLTLRMS